MPQLALNVGKYLSSIGLIPAPVQVLRRDTKLDYEIAREVFWSVAGKAGRDRARLLLIGKDCATRLKEPFRSADHADLLYDDRGLPR